MSVFIFHGDSDSCARRLALVIVAGGKNLARLREFEASSYRYAVRFAATIFNRHRHASGGNAFRHADDKKRASVKRKVSHRQWNSPPFLLERDPRQLRIRVETVAA